MTRTAALYLRVSSQGQVGEDKFGLEVQRDEAQRYANTCGLSLITTYQDVIAGTRARREQLDLLLDQAGRYEVVLISSVDRLARREARSYAVLDELLETGLEVHSADMGLIDPNAETSALNFGIRTLFAASDHRRITKRLRGGMLAKVRSGKPVVPPSGYGWHKGEHVEEEAVWIRQAATWARAGETTGWITAELNRLGVTHRGGYWRESTVKYLLRNPLHGGTYSFARARKGRGDGSQLVTCPVGHADHPEGRMGRHPAGADLPRQGRPPLHQERPGRVPAGQAHQVRPLRRHRGGPDRVAA